MKKSLNIMVLLTLTVILGVSCSKAEVINPRNDAIIKIDNVIRERSLSLTVYYHLTFVPTNPVKRYHIYRTSINDNGYLEAGVTTISCFTDTGLTTGVVYYYKVAAEDEYGQIGGYDPYFYTYKNYEIAVAEWFVMKTNYSMPFNPVDIALDETNNMYVSDMSTSQIKRYLSNGVLLTNYQFGSMPYGVCWDPGMHYLLVAMPNSNTVIRLTPGFGADQIGSSGSNDGQFKNPSYVAVDSSYNIYVTDTSNNRVQVFKPDTTFLRKWGSYGTGNGQFHTPTGIAVDHSGYVYVSDYYNNRVQKFSSLGAYITNYYIEGPLDLFIDVSNNLFVTADSFDNKIQKYDPNGILLASFCDYSMNRTLTGMTVDPTGNIMVINNIDLRFTVYQKE